MILKKPASAGFLLPRKRGWLILMLPEFPLLARFSLLLWAASTLPEVAITKRLALVIGADGLSC
jgi:hypothetical protein